MPGCARRAGGGVRTNEDVCEVVGGSAVGVGRLHDPNLQLQPRLPDEVNEEPRDQPSNLVPVEQVKDALAIGVIVDDAIGVPIKRAIPLIRHQRGPRRGLLLRLDVVGSALRVERAERGRVVASDDEGEDVVRDDFGKVAQLGSADSVGAVDGEGGKEMAALLQDIGDSVSGCPLRSEANAELTARVV